MWFSDQTESNSRENKPHAALFKWFEWQTSFPGRNSYILFANIDSMCYGTRYIFCSLSYS